MSAYGIGADAASVPAKTDVKAETKRARKTPAKKSNIPETIVKWIPGEAITFYASILGLGAAQAALTGKETPAQLLERIQADSLPWFLAGAGVSVALVIFGSFSTSTRPKNTRPSVLSVFVRSVLALLAFGLWTSALPGSWSYNLPFVRDMGAAYAILLVPIGLIFAGIAEVLTRNREV